MKIRIGIAEHSETLVQVIREAWVPLPDIELSVHAQNGWLLKHEIEEKQLKLDVVLIDLSMPVMDGVETALWLRKHVPSAKLLAMSHFESDPGLRKMLRAGCCGFFDKANSLDEFATATRHVYSKGFYNPEAHDFVLKNPFRSVNKRKALTDQQKQLLDLSYGDSTYDQIQAEMNLTSRDLNKLIDGLFSRFHVRGRNGLVLEAIRTFSSGAWPEK